MGVKTQALPGRIRDAYSAVFKCSKIEDNIPDTSLKSRAFGSPKKLFWNLFLPSIVKEWKF